MYLIGAGTLRVSVTLPSLMVVSENRPNTSNFQQNDLQFRSNRRLFRCICIQNAFKHAPLDGHG